MDMSVALICLLIFAARVVDVTLGTLRTVWIVQGRRISVFCLGFVEILIWVFAVSSVIQNLENPWYAVFYAIGFATGNYIGITLEQKLAYGEQVVRVFSRNGDELASALRDCGYGVTVFRGEGRDSPVDMCFVESRRRNIRKIVNLARQTDPVCYYVVDDVAHASTVPRQPSTEPTGWRAILKKK